MLKAEMDAASQGDHMALQLQYISLVSHRFVSYLHLHSPLNTPQPDRVRITTAVHSAAGENPRCQIVYPFAEDETPEEMVFRLQGWVVDCNLPPLTRSNQSVSSHVQFHQKNAYSWSRRLSRRDLRARQSVRLTGLGVNPFLKAVHGLLSLHESLATHRPGSTFSKFRPLEERGCVVVEVGNRFFLSQEEAGDLPVELMNPCIDPLNILGHLRDEKRGVHTEDNVVKYYERKVVPGDGDKCVRCDMLPPFLLS